MSVYVCSGAMLRCSMGLSPSSLTVLPVNRVMNNGKPQANITDNKPMVNILPFGMCRSIANPSVASATAAAWGVLTPMPCMPNTPAPWMPGKLNALVANKPALIKSSKLTCVWAGMISIQMPGQLNVKVGAKGKLNKKSVAIKPNDSSSFQLDVFDSGFEANAIKTYQSIEGQTSAEFTAARFKLQSANDSIIDVEDELKALALEGRMSGYAYKGGDKSGVGIDSIASASGFEVDGKLGGDNNPAKLQGKSKFLSATASAAGFIGDDGERVGFAFDAELDAALAKGDIKGSREFPIIFTDWSIQLKGKGSGSLGSLGGSIGAGAYYHKNEKRVYLRVAGYLAKKLGLGLDLEISIGKKYNSSVKA